MIKNIKQNLANEFNKGLYTELYNDIKKTVDAAAIMDADLKVITWAGRVVDSVWTSIWKSFGEEFGD